MMSEIIEILQLRVWHSKSLAITELDFFFNIAKEKKRKERN